MSLEAKIKSVEECCTSHVSHYPLRVRDGAPHVARVLSGDCRTSGWSMSVCVLCLSSCSHEFLHSMIQPFRRTCVTVSGWNHRLAPRFPLFARSTLGGLGNIWFIQITGEVTIHEHDGADDSTESNTSFLFNRSCFCFSFQPAPGNRS